MSLSISDARVFSAALKKARQKRKLTQAECAELLDHSVSYQKDLERGRCSPSIEGFYHICRTLNISADDCIFQDGHDRTGSTYQALLRLLPLCDEKSLFSFLKNILSFFKIFSSFCTFPYLYFIDQLFIVAGLLFFDN